MYTIHRSVDIGFAHHVRGHAGACINIHGHTWKLEVAAAAEVLDKEGFVVDFAKLKAEVLQPVFTLLDHSLAIGRETYQDVAGVLEPVGVKLLESRLELHGTVETSKSSAVEGALAGAENRFCGGIKVAVFPFNPSSERIAEWLYDLAAERLEDGRVHIPWTRVYESLRPVHSVAEYRPGPSNQTSSSSPSGS